MHCFFCKKRSDAVDADEEVEKPRKTCLCKCCKCTLITLAVLVVVLFLIIFVALPLVVTFSLEVQTFLMFPNIDQPKNPQYANFELYGAQGTRNFYVTVDDYDDLSNKVSLGIWHLVPEKLVDEAEGSEGFDYQDSLRNSGWPVILYFHGNSGTRIAPLKTYKVLRKFFHVLAFDYRSYGDSTEAKLSENAVVNDARQLYKWILKNTKSPVYVWGHSLGTALGTHTVKELKSDGIVPMGLVLEAPFTSMKEEIPVHPFGKIFAWLPWFDVTIVDPLQNNHFYFDTKENILNVDCPIMIMHAEDDPVIPYTLGKALYEIARTKRNPVLQGKASYHQFSAYLKYNHLQITSDPHMPTYIKEFVDYCITFAKQKSTA